MNWDRFLSEFKRIKAHQKRVQIGLANGLQVCGQRVRVYSARVHSGFISGMQTSKNGLKMLSKRLGVTSVRAKDGLISGFYVFGHRAQEGSKHFLSYAGQFQKSFIFGLRLGRNGLDSMFRNFVILSMRASTRLSSDLKILANRILFGFRSGLKSLQILGSQAQDGFIVAIRASSKGLTKFGTQVSLGSKILVNSIVSGFRSGSKLLQVLGNQVQDGFILGIQASGKNLASLSAQVSVGIKALVSRIVSGFRTGLKLLHAFGNRVQEGLILGMRVSSKGLAQRGTQVSFGLKVLSSGMLAGLSSGLKSLQILGNQVQNGFVVAIRSSSKGVVRLCDQVFFSSKILASSIVLGLISGLKLLQVLGNRVQAGFIDGIRVSGKVSLSLLKWLGACGVTILNSVRIGLMGLLIGLHYLYEHTSYAKAAFLTIMQTKFLTRDAYRMYAVIGACVTVYAMVHYGREFATVIIPYKNFYEVENGLNRDIIKALGVQLEASLTATAQHIKVLENKLIDQEELLQKSVAYNIGHVTEKVKELEATLSIQKDAIDQGINDKLSKFDGTLRAELAESVTMFAQTAQSIKDLESKIQDESIDKKIFENIEKMADRIDNLDTKMSHELGTSVMMSAQTAEKMKELEIKINEQAADKKIFENIEKMADRIDNLDTKMSNELGTSMMMTTQVAWQVKELDTKLSGHEKSIDQRVTAHVQKIVDRINDIDNKMSDGLEISAGVTDQAVQQIKSLEVKMTDQEKTVQKHIAQGVDHVTEHITTLDKKIRGNLESSMAITAQQVKGLEDMMSGHEQILENKLIQQVGSVVNLVHDLDTKIQGNLEATITATAQKIERIEAKMTDQEQGIEKKMGQHVEKMQDKIEACLSATVQQLKGLEQKLSVQNQAIEQKLSSYNEHQSKPIKENASAMKSQHTGKQKMKREETYTQDVEQTIKEEVSEQLGLLRLKLKEQEKKQKRKKMFDRFLNQLVGDDYD